MWPFSRKPRQPDTFRLSTFEASVSDIYFAEARRKKRLGSPVALEEITDGDETNEGKSIRLVRYLGQTSQEGFAPIKQALDAYHPKLILRRPLHNLAVTVFDERQIGIEVASTYSRIGLLRRLYEQTPSMKRAREATIGDEVEIFGGGENKHLGFSVTDTTSHIEQTSALDNLDPFARIRGGYTQNSPHLSIGKVSVQPGERYPKESNIDQLAEVINRQRQLTGPGRRIVLSPVVVQFIAPKEDQLSELSTNSA